MPDVVVTVPRDFTFEGAPGLRGLAAWIAEGDAAGEPESGEEWGFFMGGRPPTIHPGERVYIVCEDRLRGYAPLTRLDVGGGNHGYVLVRRGDAVVVTIPERVKGFRGFRYRWWDRYEERPFPEWRTP